MIRRQLLAALLIGLVSFFINLQSALPAPRPHVNKSEMGGVWLPEDIAISDYTMYEKYPLGSCNKISPVLGKQARKNHVSFDYATRPNCSAADTLRHYRLFEKTFSYWIWSCRQIDIENYVIRRRLTRIPKFYFGCNAAIVGHNYVASRYTDISPQLAFGAFASNPIGTEGGGYSQDRNSYGGNERDNFANSSVELSFSPFDRLSRPVGSFNSRLSHTSLFAKIGLVASLWAFAIGMIYGGAFALGWWTWRNWRGRYFGLFGVCLGLLIGGLNVLLILNLS